MGTIIPVILSFFIVLFGFIIFYYLKEDDETK